MIEKRIERERFKKRVEKRVEKRDKNMGRENKVKVSHVGHLLV